MDNPADLHEVVETHISWVILIEDRAFKIAKPVVTDVVDQGGVDARRHVCERELELNRRIAPDVYLGVGNLELGGEALEPVIVMRRMPEGRRLSALLASSEAPHLLSSVARKIADFHASARVLDPDEASAVASSAALANRWTDDLDGLRELLEEGEPAAGTAGAVDTADGTPAPDGGWVALLGEINRSAQRYLLGRSPLLEERIGAGMVRDGHGDLLTDDVFCLDDGPRILDCLAFSAGLRHNDVIADVAFLVMDLRQRGYPGLGRLFLDAYRDFSGEHHPRSLGHLYVAQRALVRAKVSALDSRRHPARDANVARFVRLTADHLDQATVRLVLVGGLPGSGKSTVAGQLGTECGWPVLASDEIRRDLGLRYADLGEPSAYDAATVAIVYREMRRRAQHLLERGMSVILDATWTRDDERTHTRRLASETFADIAEIRCDAPVGQCRERVAGRRGQDTESEATPDVVDLLAQGADPWPEARIVDTAGDQPGRIWPEPHGVAVG